jgi:hypothetical protein
MMEDVPVIFPPGARQAGDKSRADRVRNRYDDRDRGRRLLDRLDDRRGPRHDHVDLHAHQLRGNIGKTLDLPVYIAMLEDDVLSLDIAEVP